MKVNSSYISAVISFVVLVASSACLRAEGLLSVVTDPWPPYAYIENNQVVGTDVEIAMSVFKEMGVEAEITVMPWKRCLAVVKAKKANAILAASRTEERETFLYFPEEPVSKGITVFFKRANSDISHIDLDNRNKLRVGAMLGYSYCDKIDQSPLILGADRVADMQQNFKKLLLGRLDLIVAQEPFGYFKAKELNLSDKITVVPNAVFCPGGNFLAFSKLPGQDKLATRFSKALIAFKKTKAYEDILKKYGKPAI